MRTSGATPHPNPNPNPNPKPDPDPDPDLDPDPDPHPDPRPIQTARTRLSEAVHFLLPVCALLGPSTRAAITARC